VRAEVSDIIASRTFDESGLSRLVGWSVAVHVLGLVIAFLMPSGWLATQPEKIEIITISLGGAVGPRSTGQAPIAGRQVDVVPETPRPTPPQPPAATKPDQMAPPATKPVPVKPPPPPPQTAKAPPAETTKPLVTGAKVQTGAAAADTGATGVNQGLTLTGGAGGGDAVDLNTFDPEWTAKFKDAINRSWSRVQPDVGYVVVRFTILRDGSIEGGLEQIQVVDGNRNFGLERVSRLAVLNARLPPLPASHKEPKLIVRLRFDYER
jgi:outer membrane biosynthesis protein TonB